MSNSHIPFVAELRDEVRRTAIAYTIAASHRQGWRRRAVRLAHPPGEAFVVVLSIAAVLAVAVAFVGVHSAPHTRHSHVAADSSLSSALGPEAPGFTGTPPTSAQTALNQTAHAAASGTATPPLRRGEAWYSSARELITNQLFAGPTGGRALPEIQQAVSEEEKWFPAGGEERNVHVALAPETSGAGGGQGTPSAAPGFGDWDAMSRFTATGSPAVVLRALAHNWAGYLGYTHGNQELPDLDSSSFTILARAAAILGDEPISPATRAAIFHALATLPQLGYQSQVRDPLGRRGVAVTETTSTIRAFAVPGQQRYELQLIINPATGTVLGDRTIAAAAIPALHVHAGTVLFSWAYRLTRVVSAKSIPTLHPSMAIRKVLARFGAERQAIEAPGQACHPYASPNGGLRGPPPSSSPCGRALRAIAQRSRAALASDRAVTEALRALLSPPPAVR